MFFKCMIPQLTKESSKISTRACKANRTLETEKSNIQTYHATTKVTDRRTDNGDHHNGIRDINI
jgi:23S rRNA maturation mini-RNase III